MKSAFLAPLGLQKAPQRWPESTSTHICKYYDVFTCRFHYPWFTVSKGSWETDPHPEATEIHLYFQNVWGLQRYCYGGGDVTDQCLSPPFPTTDLFKFQVNNQTDVVLLLSWHRPRPRTYPYVGSLHDGGTVVHPSPTMGKVGPQSVPTKPDGLWGCQDGRWEGFQ